MAERMVNDQLEKTWKERPRCSYSIIPVFVGKGCEKPQKDSHDNWCPVRRLNLKIPFHYFWTSCNTSSEDIIQYEHNSTYRR